MAYRIVFTPRAVRDFEGLPEKERARLARRIDALAGDPHPPGSRKLSGSEDLYRLRAGDYRVSYAIAARIVTITIIRIGHRRDIYR